MLSLIKIVEAKLTEVTPRRTVRSGGGRGGGGGEKKEKERSEGMSETW